MKKYIKLSLILLTAIILSACQNSPKQDIVTSKNDGSFDTSILQTATIPEQQNVPANWEYIEQFTSTDGKVNFSLQLSQELSQTAMPVIQVSPHYLTEQDAKRVADVLFPNTTFYESVLALDSNMLSKNDLQEKISRWSEYTSTDALSALFPYDSSFYQQREQIVEVLKNSIEHYTKLYESAPDGNPHALCEWTFKPESKYLYAEEDLQGLDLSKDNEAIEVMLKYHDIPYYLAITKRNQQDFKLNSIFAYPETGYSPRSIDEYILRAELTRTTKPTQDQMLAICEYAQELLDKMELGVWKVDDYSLDTVDIGDFTEYTINVSAVPVIEGVLVGRREQSMNLLSDSVFASNYYITDVQFRFSSEGELLYFEMQSPIDVTYIVNDNVATLNFDELMEKAKTYFIHSDGNHYGVNVVAGSTNEQIVCNVTVSEMEYALTRVKVPNTDESYYYIPSIILRGDIEIVGSESGTLYSSKTNLELLTLNAVDGTVINSTNE